MPYLAALLILQPLLRQAYNLVSPKSTIDSSPPAAQAEARFQQRTSFDVAFGIIFLLALNGTSAAKVLLIFFMNYSIAKGLPTNWVPAATWTFNLAMLAANELCHGYPYADVARWLSLAPPLGDNWGNVLDSYGGLNSRWEVLFNITTLRLISFNLDYYWSLGQRPESPLEVCSQMCPSTFRIKLTCAEEGRRKGCRRATDGARASLAACARTRLRFLHLSRIHALRAALPRRAHPHLQ